MMAITKADVDDLIHEPSGKVRSGIAEKISQDFSAGIYNEREKKIAIDIFRLLLKDTEVRVRQVLAYSLKDSTEVPTEIIKRLASDTIDVASPILEFSYALKEEDLIQIVNAVREVPRLLAIARRETLSPGLSDALIRTGEHDVLTQVIRNKGAQISETSLAYLLEEYYEDNSVLEELVYRGGLPYHFAERLFSLVSDELCHQLTKRYRLSKQVSDEAIENARQTAVLQFLSPWMSQQDIESLVDEMQRNNRLNYSVIIRALCIGDLRFFEAAMAKLVGIPTTNARILMLDPGALGFRSFYKSAHMPMAFCDAVKVIFDLAQEETDYGRYHVENYGQRMIEKVISEGYDKTVENMPYLMSIIGSSILENKKIA